MADAAGGYHYSCSQLLHGCYLFVALPQDVYDKQRQLLIKRLKVDGSTWVSKYARGGSAKTQSARNMYIAVDAVQGYMASNG
jgi:hypothetical protein